MEVRSYKSDVLTGREESGGRMSFYETYARNHTCQFDCQGCWFDRAVLGGPTAPRLCECESRLLSSTVVCAGVA